jgi:glycosyltransferase involved in cell wall biosynthesis
MQNDNPLVSIITIVYNGVTYIEDTIKSVLSQTYNNIEYLLIDGGSTDGTLDVIKRYENKGIKWISEKDKGISDAFNKGIKLSNGTIIGIINADDWYENDAIEKIVKLYVDDNTILCGSVRLYNSSTKFNIKISSLAGVESKMDVWHPGMFVPTDVYKKVGLYDINYKVLMDYDFVVRCYKLNVSFKIVNNVVANMRYGGISNKLISKSMKEALAIKNKYFGTSVKNNLEYLYFNLYYHTIIFIKGIIYK